MKNVTITLKDESIKGNDVHIVASKLTNEGLKVSSVQPYGVITGDAEEDAIERFKQNKELYVNDNPPIHQIPPSYSDLQ